MDITTILFACIAALVGGGIVWLLTRRQGGGDEGAALMAQMHQQLMEQMERMNQQVDRRLSENARAIEHSQRSVHTVNQLLGKLEQSTAELHQKSNEIVSFQNLLKAPKIRGSFGEVLLGNLLADVLPQDRYELQYTFRDSREIADAIIRLQDGYIVAVDAKFPFAHYEAFMKEHDSAERASLRKAFIRDVKKHISDISQKYISSHEKTLDYAFMYIPIEGVYYETMVHPEKSPLETSGQATDLWTFCLENKVVPVSPNSFLAYLQTVLVGLRGMKIEQKTREILQYIGALRQDFGKFSEDFMLAGKHLNNAKVKYEDSTRRLDKLANRFEQIEGAEAQAPAELE